MELTRHVAPRISRNVATTVVEIMTGVVVDGDYTLGAFKAGWPVKAMIVHSFSLQFPIISYAIRISEV